MSKMRETVRRAIHSDSGKAVRWTAITAASLRLKSPEAAIPISGFDSLVMDRLVSQPGRLAFLSKLFPTIFTRHG